MIRRHIRLLRLGLMVADATSAFVLFGLILALRFEFLDPSAEWRAGAGPAQLAAAYGAIWVGSLWLLGLYRPRTYWSLRGEVIDLLRAVADQIASAVRADDRPARYGGEEFAVVLRRASPQQAVEVAGRIRGQIAQIRPSALGTHEPVTVSIGVAVGGTERTEDARSLLADADSALYRAKREGRNRVVLWRG